MCRLTFHSLTHFSDVVAFYTHERYNLWATGPVSYRLMSHDRSYEQKTHKRSTMSYERNPYERNGMRYRLHVWAIVMWAVMRMMRKPCKHRRKWTSIRTVFMMFFAIFLGKNHIGLFIYSKRNALLLIPIFSEKDKNKQAENTTDNTKQKEKIP